MDPACPDGRVRQVEGGECFCNDGLVPFGDDC